MTSWVGRIFAVSIFGMLFLMGFAGLSFGLNPLDPRDYDQDPDNDGLNNLQEFLAGSDRHCRGPDRNPWGQGGSVRKRDPRNPL